jgi:integral membrane sensor domain MASE1
MKLADQTFGGSPWLPPVSHLLGLVGIFFTLASAALAAFGPASPVWYANAIAVVILLGHKANTWPVFAVALWLTDAMAVHLFGHDLGWMIAVADVLEIVLTSSAIRLTGGVRWPVFKGAQILRIVTICLAVPIVTGALGAAAISSEQLSFRAAWHVRYSASAQGHEIMVPFVLSLMDPGMRSRIRQAMSPVRALLLA